MPMYLVECRICQERSDIFRKMSEYDDLPAHCGERMLRVICAPAIHADLPPYISPASGKLINSRSAQAEDLKRTNSILNEPGLKSDIARWKVETEEKAFAPVAAGVDEAVKRLVATNQIES